MMNNDKWIFEGKMLKNKFSLNKVISYFFHDDVDIPVLNNSVDSIKNASYDIQTNTINLSLGINIGLNLKLFSLEKA